VGVQFLKTTAEGYLPNRQRTATQSEIASQSGIRSDLLDPSSSAVCKFL
jgi:hypothetical protein